MKKLLALVALTLFPAVQAQSYWAPNLTGEVLCLDPLSINTVAPSEFATTTLNATFRAELKRRFTLSRINYADLQEDCYLSRIVVNLGISERKDGLYLYDLSISIRASDPLYTRRVIIWQATKYGYNNQSAAAVTDMLISTFRVMAEDLTLDYIQANP